jgi:hypothetical protein
MGGRAGGYGTASWGDVLRVPDLGEVPDMLEALGDLFDGYEREDAWRKLVRNIRMVKEEGT